MANGFVQTPSTNFLRSYGVGPSRVLVNSVSLCEKAKIPITSISQILKRCFQLVQIKYILLLNETKVFVLMILNLIFQSIISIRFCENVSLLFFSCTLIVDFMLLFPLLQRSIKYLKFMLLKYRLH